MALIVGTCINLYSQLLVPWLRGGAHPFDRFLNELRLHPTTTTVSVLLAYAFPLLVGLYSSVTTRYTMRVWESRAPFPDLKPGPVFRVTPTGEIVERGARTARLFDALGVTTAQTFLGDAWPRLAEESGDRVDGVVVYSEPMKQRFVVSASRAPDGTINVYASAYPPEC